LGFYIGGGVDNEILDDIIEDILVNQNIKTRRTKKENKEEFRSLLKRL
jgi:hypothetical protein